MPTEETLCSLSHTRGPSRPLLELTVGDLLIAPPAAIPTAWPWLRCHQGKRLTWAEL
jgi:hypothetical protein